MKHYYARQRHYDRRWEFVVESDELVHSIGYCVGVIDLDDQGLIESLGGKDSIAYLYYANRVRPFLEWFHVNGHETKEEACACYRKYLIDSSADFNVRLIDSDNCAVCGARTMYGATVGALSYSLCDIHRNKNDVGLLMPTLLELFK